jgi:hypothetical protein
MYGYATAHNPFRRKGRDGMIPTTSGKATSAVVGIIDSPQVTKGNFNAPRVVKPQVVGIEIDLSDKCRIHHPYPFS